MAAGREEHRISIPGASVAPGNISTDDEEEDMAGSLPGDPPNADEEWIREMEEKIDMAFEGSAVLMPSSFKVGTGPKICKLPLLLRDRISLQPGSETEEGRLSQPSVVEIGPFHRRRQGPDKIMSITDREKLIIVGLMNIMFHLDLASCLVKIKDQVADARNSYDKLDELAESSGFKYEKKIFAEMLLLDSCFILFTLTITLRKGLAHYTLTPPKPKNKSAEPRPPLKLFQDDHFEFLEYIVFNKDDIAPDLLIFDNQIPFFVIEELFEELQLKEPLYEHALRFFETIHPRSARHCRDKNTGPPRFLHLLDLFHWSRVPQNKYILSEQVDPNIGWARHTPNARELRESATALEKETSGGSALEIAFRGRRFTPIVRVLDVPELHIRDYSGLVFHNLIAFEIQYSSGRSRCAMAFSALMQNLLQREEDVKLLRERGVLASSSMTDGELVDLFARLSRSTENHRMPSEMLTVCHHVVSHHNRPVSRFLGSVIIRFFPSPLVTLTVFGAILLFIPTILQTIYTML